MEKKAIRVTAKGKPDKRMKVRRAGITENGRPGKPVDWDKVDDLLTAGCLGTEVASFFDMHPQTFYNKVIEKYSMSFTEYSTKKKQNGEAILRTHQYAKALGITKEGDNTLLIWLGKQRLNQRETPEDVEVSEAAIKNLNALVHQLDSLQKVKKI